MLLRFVFWAVLAAATSPILAQGNCPSGLPSLRGEGCFPDVMGKAVNADWEMTRMRFVNLNDSANTPLRTASDGREFFPYLLSLVLDGKVETLEYDMAGEGFHMGGTANVKKVLEDNSIAFGEAGGKVRVNNMASLSADIEAYYIIDSEYYDVALGKCRHCVYAICPVMVKYGNLDEATRFPLFWVMGRDIEPYLNTWFVPVANEKECLSLASWLSMDMYHESSPEEIGLKGEE